MTTLRLPVLDLATLGPQSGRPGQAYRKRSGWLAALAALAAVCLAAAALRSLPETGFEPGAAPGTVRFDLAPARAIAALNVDDRSQIIAQGGEAESHNAQIAFAPGKTAPMRAFMLDAQARTAASALKCLTQAIYYEAATEPVAGRRAVAQVVLNRVRHPAYPKSVCGVVYQGAERSTGCQFSFTCDGSLLRAPMAGPWRQAEALAREALAGKVAAEVGTATHYHADYVLPRWAFEMDKISRLGRHLFYRFGGSWGRPAFFTGGYDGHEAIPELDFVRLRARLLSSQGGGSVPAEAPGHAVLSADTSRHAVNDVGGRLDVTRAWRLAIPDPVEASQRYRAIVGAEPAGDGGKGTETGGEQ